MGLKNMFTICFVIINILLITSCVPSNRKEYINPQLKEFIGERVEFFMNAMSEGDREKAETLFNKTVYDPNNSMRGLTLKRMASLLNVKKWRVVKMQHMPQENTVNVDLYYTLPDGSERNFLIVFQQIPYEEGKPWKINGVY